MEERHRVLSGVFAAAMVGLWNARGLIAVLLSEPPPTRRRAMRESAIAVVSSLMGYAAGWASYDWGAAFVNGLVEKHLGMNPNVSPIVASLAIAVVTTQYGPDLLRKVGAVFGKPTEAAS